MDQLQSIIKILESIRECNIDSYALFIDFSASYNSIHTENLLSAMIEFDISGKLINLVGMTFNNVKLGIKVKSSFSKPFSTGMGVR